MMKNRKYLALGLCIIMYILSSCSKAPHNDQNSVINNPEEVVSINNSSEDEVATDYNVPEAEIRDEVNKETYINRSRLGGATFILDESNYVTKDFLADGNDVILELTDKSGITWTLSIPEDALLNPRTITMKALSDVRSDTFQDLLSGGIILEPDGLQFLNPATLIITGGKLNRQSMVFQESHDGLQLDYTYFEQKEDSKISCPVYHFSSAFVAEGAAIEEISESANRDYEDACQAIKELLKEPVEVLAPPSYDLRCKNEDDISAEPIDNYLKEFKNPEEEAEIRLLGAIKLLQLSGNNDVGIDHPLLRALYKRELKKVDTLIKTYKYQPEKYLYATRAITSVIKKGALLGFIDNDTQHIYIDTVGKWAVEARKYYLSELKKNHDFKAFSAVANLTKTAVMYGGLDFNQAFEELSKAMSFKLYFESEDTDTSESYKLSGEIPVKLNPEDFTILGTGIGHYDSYEYYDKFQTSQYIGPSNFNINVEIENFKPCENTLDIVIDRFGSLQESFLVVDSDGDTTTDVYDNEQNAEDPTVHTELQAAFWDHREDTDNFRFQVNLNNLSNEAVNQNFVKDWGFGSYAKINFKLIHDPK